jgi:two-component system alkaline phosphatase synthesis response regulator PhoP
MLFYVRSPTVVNYCVAQKHVLIVEDEPDFAALLRSILADAGYSVAVAYNFVDAFSEVRKARPDLITLDIRMPKRSGVYFYRELKTTEDFRDIPVIVVSGIVGHEIDMEDIVRSFLETAYMPHPEAYIEKPVDGQRLLRVVERVLSSPTSGNGVAGEPHSREAHGLG